MQRLYGQVLHSVATPGSSVLLIGGLKAASTKVVANKNNVATEVIAEKNIMNAAFGDGWTQRISRTE